MLFFPKIGPDMYVTHWLLFVKPLRLWFQNIKLGQIGSESEIRPYCTIHGPKNIFIGDRVIVPEYTRLITDYTDINSRIIIDDDVLFGPNVALYATTHTFSKVTKPVKSQPLKNAPLHIKKGAWIGINSVILPGITIGYNAVIGANSVVTKDVPDHAICVGAPARIVRIQEK